MDEKKESKLELAQEDCSRAIQLKKRQTILIQEGRKT